MHCPINTDNFRKQTYKDICKLYHKRYEKLFLLLLSCSSLETRNLLLNLSPPTAGKYLRKTNKNKIKAQPIISPRTIPRPPSHHALKRIRDNKTIPHKPTTPKDNIILKKITLKDGSLNREETFYSTFNSIPSIEPPKAEKAPTEIQLDLPADETFTPLSRASTTLSTAKITLDISSARKKDVIKITSPKAPPSRKEKRVNTTPRTEKQPSRQISRSRPVTRDRGARLSVKTMKNAATYVKKANALKGVKLKSKTFKKNVKLVGIVKKPKKKLQKSDEGEKKVNEAAVGKPVSDANNEHETKETDVYGITKHIPKSNKLEATFIDVEDANFFMCSNETDDLPPVEKEIEQEVEIFHNNVEEKTLETQIHRPQSPVVVKPMPAKHHKFVLPKFKNTQPPAFNFSAIIDKAKKVSKMNTNKLKMKKERAGLKTDATVENSAISSFIKDLKSSMKRTRRKKKQKMPALSRYARIPTLINWVEYSDLLQTPSMQMQQRLSLNNDTNLINVNSN